MTRRWVSRRTWNRRYRRYLMSPVWKDKRFLVRCRSGGWCEAPGCRERAREVHHLRYPAVLGSEPITWLRDLCEAHHRQAHRRVYAPALWKAAILVGLGVLLWMVR